MKLFRHSFFRSSILLTLAWGLFALPAFSTPTTPTELSFRVVVHEDHPLDEIPRDVLARIFMNKMSRWDDGTQIIAVDLPLEHPARVAFSKVVLKKSTNAVNNYWQRMIFSGRGVPPAQIRERDLLDFLCSEPGAIGYIHCDTPLIEGVKELRVVDGDGEALRLSDVSSQISLEESDSRNSERLSHGHAIRPSLPAVRSMVTLSTAKPGTRLFT